MKNLIVEGFGDKVFFEKYCVHHAFDVDVTVITPEDIDSQNNEGVQNSVSVNLTRF